MRLSEMRHTWFLLDRLMTFMREKDPSFSEEDHTLMRSLLTSAEYQSMWIHHDMGYAGLDFNTTGRGIDRVWMLPLTDAQGEQHLVLFDFSVKGTSFIQFSGYYQGKKYLPLVADTLNPGVAVTYHDSVNVSRPDTLYVSRIMTMDDFDAFLAGCTLGSITVIEVE